MKQHTGDEIRTIMKEMPDEQVAVLQAAHAEHRITEREALVGIFDVRANWLL